MKYQCVGGPKDGMWVVVEDEAPNGRVIRIPTRCDPICNYKDEPLHTEIASTFRAGHYRINLKKRIMEYVGTYDS